MPKTRLLIIDDHPMMREALQMATLGEDDLEVIGEAASAEEGFKLLETLQPDVILIDLLMPGMGGLKAIEQLFRANPGSRILVISSLEDEDKILAAIQAGALGYYPKTAARAHLLEAIRTVADGLPYLPNGIALKLFAGLRKQKPAGQTSSPEITLTARQHEILSLLAEGRSDEEIAATLHIETATVRSHIHHLLQRLGLESRTQAVAFAARQYRQD